MKREEYDKAVAALAKASQAVDSGCPPQTEWLNPRVSAVWRAEFDATPFEARIRVMGHPYDQSLVDNLSTEALLRVVEIRQALDAWNRNEGPWPMAHKKEEGK